MIHSSRRSAFALLLLPALPANALSLGEAEALALRSDPVVETMRAHSRALSERAIAEAQLPDPRLKLGLNAVPIDTFDLDQEPMTQLQIGLSQQFLPGDTLELRGRRLRQQAGMTEHMATDRRLQTLRSVREDYLELLFLQESSHVLLETRVVFVELLTLAQDSYATGRSQQQNVFHAELELSRLDERQLRVSQARDIAQAQLASWVGESTTSSQLDWPTLTAPDDWQLLDDQLEQHPRSLAATRQVDAAETVVDLAREQYRPGWMLDLTYGDRSGQNLDGSARADFLMAMVTVQLPLFTTNRQDRRLRAAAHDHDAALAARADVLRELLRQTGRERAALGRLNERLELLDEQLLPQAALNSSAALSGYQSGVDDFESLLRARATELSLQLDLLRLRTDRLQTITRLRYLSGDQP